MSDAEKLVMLKSLLTTSDTEDETKLVAYLDLAGAEIVSWLWSGSPPSGTTSVPSQYEPTQIYAVLAGYSQEGAAGQTSHGENSTSRVWKYESMLAFIRSHVTAFIKVM